MLSCCILDISVGERAFVIELSQISYFSPFNFDLFGSVLVCFLPF